jgi:hypothetical protein
MNNLSRSQIAQELQRRGINPGEIFFPMNEVPSSPSRKELIAQELIKRGIGPDTKLPLQSNIAHETASLAKGALAGLAGGALDTAALVYNLPAMLHNWQESQRQQIETLPPEKQKLIKSIPQIGIDPFPKGTEAPYIPSATEAIEKEIDTLSGGYTETPPELKHLYEGVRFAGSLASVGGLGKAAGKVGLKGLEKAGEAFGTLKPSQLGGAVATGTAMSAADEKLGTLPGLGAGIAAGALTTKGLKGISELGKGLKGTITGKGPSLGDMTIGRALSIKGEPSLSVMKTAKEYGIQLPFNIPLKSPVADFLANTALNSLFTTKKYKDIIEKSPLQLKEKFINIIDQVHPENIGKTEASREYYTALKREEQAVEDKAKELYDYSRNFLKSSDKVIPTNTIKALKDLKVDLSAPVPSSPMKFVIDRIGKLSKAWDLIPPSFQVSKEFEADIPHFYDKISDALRKKPKALPVESLIQQRQAFMQDLRDKEAKGVQRQLGKIIKALDEDISSLSNHEFLNHWRAANSYFKNEVAQRIRSDFTRSMLEGVFPKEAFDYMTSPGRINELQRILGSSSDVKRIINSLKRTKLQQILIDPSISSEGSMNMATFANKFMKNSKDYDLLKSLLGEKSFSDLKKLSEIAQSFSSAGKSFSNPSGTTVRLQDLARLGGIGGVIFSGGTGALPVASSIAMPLILSKLLTNPRYTEAAMKYALAAGRNKASDAQYFQKNMKNIFYDTMKKTIPYSITEQSKNR